MKLFAMLEVIFCVEEETPPAFIMLVTTPTLALFVEGAVEFATGAAGVAFCAKSAVKLVVGPETMVVVIVVTVMLL